jgi:uncharacterized membrane protein YeaQ/YmgE (transglycosylase-associated protein family)
VGIIVWIIIGAIGGWLACRLTGRAEGKDYALYLGFGILGAVAGGFITNLVIFRPVFEFNWQNALVAVLASGVFLVVINALRR